MANLREKLKEARDEETRKEENEMKSRWGAKEPIAPPPVPPPSGPPPGALAENRSSVAMSWGTGQKPGNRASAGRESAERGIKVAPIVGKMPWAKGTVGRKSKFGPPVEGGVYLLEDRVSIMMNLSHGRCPSPKHRDQPTDPPSHTRPRPRPTSPRLGSSTWHQERLGEHELIPGTFSFQASWSTQSIFPPAASNAILGFPQLWLWKRGW